MEADVNNCDKCGVKLAKYFSASTCEPCRKRKCIDCGIGFRPSKLFLRDRCAQCHRNLSRSNDSISLDHVMGGN